LKRPKHILLRLLLVAIPLLMALAPAMAQNTMYAGQSGDLGVIPVSGDTYLWELYKDAPGINFATDPGNCTPGFAYFTGNDSTGPSVNVTWITPGTYFFKVTASRAGCTMNLKVGLMTVINSLPTAVITPPPLAICAGDPAHLTVTLTGTAPWSITYTDGTNTVTIPNILTSPYDLVVNPTTTTNYWITSVTDANGTNATPTTPVTQVVNPRPLTTPIFHH
jgi:hypothetical protein